MINEAIITALLIEDDLKLASLTRQYLETHGLIVTVEHSGGQGLKTALLNDFDIILLDLLLPEIDGIQICQKVREQKDVPIIMLTARGEEADRVLGLEIGADDYMAKPFSPRELLARIRVQIRRRRKSMSSAKKNTLSVGSLIIVPDKREVKLSGHPLDLTSYEFAILFALADNAGRALSRDRLMDLAKGSADEAFDRSIDVHISRLRKKMAGAKGQQQIIKTIRGVGYLLLQDF
jgi:DNA-binding response OmpR family regulator